MVVWRVSARLLEQGERKVGALAVQAPAPPPQGLYSAVVERVGGTTTSGPATAPRIRLPQMVLHQYTVVGVGEVQQPGVSTRRNSRTFLLKMQLVQVVQAFLEAPEAAPGRRAVQLVEGAAADQPQSRTSVRPLPAPN